MSDERKDAEGGIGKHVAGFSAIGFFSLWLASPRHLEAVIGIYKKEQEKQRLKSERDLAEGRLAEAEAKLAAAQAETERLSHLNLINLNLTVHSKSQERWNSSSALGFESVPSFERGESLESDGDELEDFHRTKRLASIRLRPAHNAHKTPLMSQSGLSDRVFYVTIALGVLGLSAAIAAGFLSSDWFVGGMTALIVVKLWLSFARPLSN